MLEIEVNKVICLVRYVAAKISTDHTVPARRVFPIELFFYINGDVLNAADWISIEIAKQEWKVCLLNFPPIFKESLS